MEWKRFPRRWSGLKGTFRSGLGSNRVDLNGALVIDAFMYAESGESEKNQIEEELIRWFACNEQSSKGFGHSELGKWNAKMVFARLDGSFVGFQGRFLWGIGNPFFIVEAFSQDADQSSQSFWWFFIFHETFCSTFPSKYSSLRQISSYFSNNPNYSNSHSCRFGVNKRKSSNNFSC